MTKAVFGEIFHHRPRYLVTITGSGKEARGKIEDILEGKELTFDPLNVLADLSYTQEKIPLPDEIILDSQYEYEYAFGERLEVNDREQYTQFVMCIKDLLKYIEELKPPKNVLGLKYMEILKSYYHITFEFTPFDEIEPVYGCSPDFPSLSSLVPKIDSTIENFKYACYFSTDIIFSILHFLAFNEYKICKCVHCGKYFATYSNKNKYCTRKSPYPNYEHLNCEQAVRNFQQYGKRVHKQIYNNLYEHHALGLYNKFAMESNDAKDRVRANPSVENMQLWESVLDKNKWYKMGGKNVSKKK